MKFILIAALAASAVAHNPWKINNNGTISCHKLGTFCAGDSGKTNIIIHCQDKHNATNNYAGNCNDNLAGVCGGVCEFAPCKQTSPKKGDGYCSVDGAIAANGSTLHDPSEEHSTTATKRALLARFFHT
ncbi:MAG: hypothetical protein GOMPHAMPRED_001414 [Gomphillus americanus]|uniref:Uncharacterized protein n=1 Tax=Gomphillus americanus TaxID=1940652 RepID=A0A8H3F9F4_9LECA|nr:MAG: hypothetical protein GOMPHAMPRED_001414 [Gomphillus americanus]